MKLALRNITGLLLLLLVAATPLHADTDTLLNSLSPRGYVSDFAGVISTQDVTRLTDLLNELENKTTAEIAVVTVSSMEGGEISDFANQLFAKWGIGQKGKDNGVMLIASISDHKIRIEVGYGLEGILNDAKTGRILDEDVLPAFREGNYGQGMVRGAQTISAILAQENHVALTNQPVALTPAQTQAPATPSSPSSSSPVGGFIFLGFVIIFIVIFIVARKGKGGGSSGGSSYPSSSSGSSGGFSSGSSSHSSSGFGGGRSGGGGASRSW